MYKNIYNDYIKHKEDLIERVKAEIEADKVIHTTYVQPDKSEEWKKNPEIQKRFKRQWASMRRLELRRILTNE